ncbi:hypothetical protein [Catenulispora rubra]|uniref:hypothetical protein n=1 Tax=Catenulispora rubra TaxID=280293 RepID=UPI0018924634|nr:hypothetical protein [Catenulispora rubra]
MVELGWLALVCVVLVGAGVHSAAAGVVFLLGVIVNGWILIPAFMVRVLTIGIYVGDRGLKIRNSIRTYILHWDEIRGVEEGPIRWGSRNSANMRAIWIITKRGKRIETQVHCRVGPKSYMRREKIGSILSETEFAAALEELRARISGAAI